jgi:hypothetical protein
MNSLRSPVFSIVFNRAFCPVIQQFPNWYISFIKYTKILKKVMKYSLCSLIFPKLSIKSGTGAFLLSYKVLELMDLYFNGLKAIFKIDTNVSLLKEKVLIGQGLRQGSLKGLF